MSLRLRLTLLYSVLLALTLAAFSVVLYSTMQRNLEAEMDRRLDVRASQVQLTIWPGTRTLTPDDLTTARLDLSPLADLDAPNVYVQVLGRDGQVVATSETLRGATLPVDARTVSSVANGQRDLGNVELAPGRTIRMLSIPIHEGGDIIGVLQVGQSRQPLQETMAGLRTLLQLLVAGAVAIGGLLAWLMADRGLAPLRLISARAVAIARQRAFDRRLGLGPRHDEVGQIANTIDHLLLTVEETLHSHRQFVADTSHELRNPLLAIHTNLELLDRVNDPADRAECVREAREQVERMSRLVADLIVLARTDAGELVERRPVALRPLVERVACEARRHATGHRVCVERAADVVVQGDAHRLTQILTNLVDNATRHTPSGGTIRLGLNREDGWVCVYVSDSGEGIPPEHLPHLFNRFYQVDRAGGGVGLGLSIVKHLAEAHGGRVEVESEPGRGSCFTVWLPVEDAARLARA